MAAPDADKLYHGVTCALKQFQLELWARHDQFWPDLAYHYTSLGRLEEILQSRVFWATSMEDAKDQTEGHYAVGVANDVVAAHPEWPFGDGVRTLCQYCDMLPGLGSRWHVYTVCFCATGTSNNLWERYGSGGTGVAIGIHPKDWHTTRGTYFARMAYDRFEQNTAVEMVCKEAAKLYEMRQVPSNSPLHKHFCAAVWKELAFHTLLRFKKPDLSPEQEWRMMQEFSGEPKAFPRSMGCRMVRYVEVPLDKEAICRVVLGPRADAANAQHVRDLLRCAAMPHVVVRRCT